ncbi:L,D-transpeptidase family protein [Tabrizicola sp.]|jgi:murein L,D-transpeptidase YafK|uniref:L,D-transpeptidase family protein n=1 Tax=Tabrizicola sp. TaxID=2005166 RepID=UPI0025F8F25E|nr:L,D-transpeptidase family protein [Tabrizicola sp.]MBY0350021.1 L,D-transpeptidase family protein [Tabrizicola sp.]
MRFFRVIAILVIGFGLAGCGSKFRTYNGPEVTQIQVSKADRKLYLFNNDRVLQSYDIGLGFAPVGAKQFEGDGKTPEGAYTISYKNPDSQFHLSLKISYPNEADTAFAEAQGKSPGGDIVIHGGPKRPTNKRDWTWGCIAVTDREIEVIYSMVKEGTPIYIMP